jgi:hypothetical protein
MILKYLRVANVATQRVHAFVAGLVGHLENICTTRCR